MSNTSLGDFEKSQSCLHQLLTSIVSKLHILEGNQVALKQTQQDDINNLRLEIEINSLGLKRIDDRLNTLELEMNNVICEIQGYRSKTAVTLSKLSDEEKEKPPKKKNDKTKANSASIIPENLIETSNQVSHKVSERKEMNISKKYTPLKR